MDLGDNDIVIGWAGGTPPVHPALLARPDVRAALAAHDLASLFRVLGKNGWTQRAIGAAAGSPSLRSRRSSGAGGSGNTGCWSGSPTGWGFPAN